VKVPQDNKEICLAVHPITFWLDQSCVKKMIVSYILLFIKLQLIFLFVPQIKKAGRREMSEGIVCCRLMELISG